MMQSYVWNLQRLQHSQNNNNNCVANAICAGFRRYIWFMEAMTTSSRSRHQRASVMRCGGVAPASSRQPSSPAAAITRSAWIWWRTIGSGTRQWWARFDECFSSTSRLPDWFEPRSLSITRLCLWFTVITGPDFTKYLTATLRLAYDNVKVTIDLRWTSNLPNIIRDNICIISLRYS